MPTLIAFYNKETLNYAANLNAGVQSIVYK